MSTASSMDPYQALGNAVVLQAAYMEHYNLDDKLSTP